MGVGGGTDLLNPVPKKRKSKHLYGQLGPPRQYQKNFCVSQFIPSFSMSGGVFCHVICTEGALRRPMTYDDHANPIPVHLKLYNAPERHKMNKDKERDRQTDRHKNTNIQRPKD